MIKDRKIEEVLLRNAGFFTTPRRVRMLEIFHERALGKKNEPKHLTAEDLYDILNEEGMQVSLGTIYRALSAFADKGLLRQLSIIGDRAYYEWAKSNGHHDHIVCPRCGKIEEFHDESIEHLQRKIAERNGFTLTDHLMVLYGSCYRCSHENKK